MKYQSILFGFIALLILAMAMVIPMISGQNHTPPYAAPIRGASEMAKSPYMQIVDRQRSTLMQVTGGVFFRGTMPDESERAADQCADSGLNCNVSSAEDSYPPHRLRVETFWMEATEVTYQQYAAFLNTLGPGGHLTGCDGQFCIETQQENTTSSISFDGTNYTTSNPAVNDYPVAGVTWYGAQAYCEALGRRLPTEAEWEYAARGEDGTLYPWGNVWNDAAANVRGSYTNEDGVVIASPQPVGGYGAYASRDGIRDLAGNVAEWVADWYIANWYLQLSPNTVTDTGPDSGTEKVIRGGSWDDPAFFARSVQRGHLPPGEVSNTVGFRCVAD